MIFSLPIIASMFVLHFRSFDMSPAVAIGCAEVASSIAQRLGEVAFVQDQAGVFRAVFEHGYESYPNCSESEPIAYALARTAELGFARLPIDIDGRKLSTVNELVEALAARHPRSARIATVRARRLVTIVSAEAALAIDSSYPPAVLALAAAKLAADDPKAALKLLDGLRKVNSLPGFHTLRARILFADGNSRAAVREASQDARGNWTDAIEPFLTMAVRRDAEEALGRALLGAGKRSQGISHLRSAADMGSDAAKQALAAQHD
jgi:hypothetical protein